MQLGHSILQDLIKWTQPLTPHVEGKEASLSPTPIPTMSEDSWGSEGCGELCSRPRPFDFCFPLPEIFSTVHLSCSLYFLPAFPYVFFLDSTQILLLKVLTTQGCAWDVMKGLGPWSHAKQLNFRYFCSQKPLTMLPLGSRSLLG